MYVIGIYLIADEGCDNETLAFHKNGSCGRGRGTPRRQQLNLVADGA
jgi:hypothetical protein